MTLRHLKIFIAVADLGSMTAASQVLHIAQPTVSQAISELERHYRTKLFDRISRRLHLTEAGSQLLSYARHVISLFDEMEQAIINADKSGILRIGASVTVGTYLLPLLVNQFVRLYPEIRLKVITKNTADVENLIANNSLDFGVVEGAVHNRDLISQTFMDDELVIVCGRSHPLYKGKKIPPHKLGEFDFIVREEGSGTRELFANTMAAYDINWQLGWECNGSDTIKNAAISGIGLGVISKLLVEKEIATGELAVIKVQELNLKRKFSIIFHKNKYLTKAMKDFCDLCYLFTK